MGYGVEDLLSGLSVCQPAPCSEGSLENSYPCYLGVDRGKKKCIIPHLCILPITSNTLANVPKWLEASHYQLEVLLDGKNSNHCLNTRSSKHVNRPMIIAFSLFSVPALTINLALSKSPHFPFKSSNLLTSLWYRFLLSVRMKIEPMTSHCNTFVDLVCSIPIFPKFVTLITGKIFESIMLVIYCTSSL